MKDQQTNNVGTQEEVNNATPWQENAQQDGNNMPSPGKNEGVGANDKPLTTEGFHTLLAANTFKLSQARREYATEIADLQKEYDDTLDKILEKEHQANFELREARDEYERAKEEYEQTLRDLKRESATRLGKPTTRARQKPRTAGLPTTRISRPSATTSSSFTEIRGGYSREPRKDSFIQVGPETRKEE